MTNKNAEDLSRVMESLFKPTEDMRWLERASKRLREIEEREARSGN